MSEVPDPGDHPVVLFDGVCNLCNGTVQFLLEQDEAGVLRFAPLQSDPGQALLEARGMADHDLDSIVLVDGEDVYVKSDAALRIADYLDTPVSLASHLEVVPRSLRDRVYDLTADYRYRIFGKRDQCMVPDPEVQSRFLAMDEPTVDAD